MEGTITNSYRRAALVLAQALQSTRKEKILEAYSEAMAKGWPHPLCVESIGLRLSKGQFKLEELGCESMLDIQYLPTCLYAAKYAIDGTDRKTREQTGQSIEPLDVPR